MTATANEKGRAPAKSATPATAGADDTPVSIAPHWGDALNLLVVGHLLEGR